MVIDPANITDPPTPPPGGTPPAPALAPTPAPTGAKTALDNWPEDAQSLVRELRDENAGWRQKAAAEAAAKKTAEAEKMKQRGEFEELAKQHEARVKELEPQIERLQSLSEQVGTLINTITKEWPPELKAFDPGKSADVDQRLAWLLKAQGLLPEVAARQRAGSPGSAPGPRPTAKPTAQENMEELQRRARATGRYGI